MTNKQFIEEWKRKRSFQPFDPRKAGDFGRDPFDLALRELGVRSGMGMGMLMMIVMGMRGGRQQCCN